MSRPRWQRRPLRPRWAGEGGEGRGGCHTQVKPPAGQFVLAVFATLVASFLIVHDCSLHSFFAWWHPHGHPRFLGWPSLLRLPVLRGPRRWAHVGQRAGLLILFSFCFVFQVEQPGL